MIYGAAAILVWPLRLCSLGELPAPCTSVACYESLIPEALDALGIRQWERSGGVSGGPLLLASPAFCLGLGAVGSSSLGSPGPRGSFSGCHTKGRCGVLGVNWSWSVSQLPTGVCSSYRGGMSGFPHSPPELLLSYLPLIMGDEE